MNTKTRRRTTAQKTRLWRTTDFKSTKAEKNAADEIAYGLGHGLLQSIAKGLGCEYDTCFKDNGLLRPKVKATVQEFAIAALNTWLDKALVEGWLNQQVVNEMRVELALIPLY